MHASTNVAWNRIEWNIGVDGSDVLFTINECLSKAPLSLASIAERLVTFLDIFFQPIAVFIYSNFRKIVK